VYAFKLKHAVESSTAEKTESINKQSARIIHMTRVGEICGICLILSEASLIIIYVIDSQALVYAFFPMLLLAEIVPSGLILHMQRRVQPSNGIRQSHTSTFQSTTDLVEKESTSRENLNHQNKN